MTDVPVTDFKIRGENLQKEEEGRRTLMDDDQYTHPTHPNTPKGF
jgi:hypothetical protein